jgi:hypothetical protein
MDKAVASVRDKHSIERRRRRMREPEDNMVIHLL